MNSCNFYGRLGSDSKLATSKAGNAYLKFDLALNTYRKGQNETLWIRCTVFGKQAESLALQLYKGTTVAVTGAIDLNTFTDKDGKARADLQLVANNVTVAHQAATAKQAQPEPQSELHGANHKLAVSSPSWATQTTVLRPSS